MRLYFEMMGEEILQRDLLRSAERATMAQPAFEAIIEAMQSDTAEQFASQGGAQSGGWKPLAPSTIANKARLNLRPEILRATDRMMDAFTGDTGDTVKEVLPFEFSWGVNVDYAVYHQKGNDDGRPPQRRIIDFTEAQKVKYVKILQRYIIEGARK